MRSRRYLLAIIITLLSCSTNAGNYTIYDDLSDITIHPNKIISEHSPYLWIIPTLFLYVNDTQYTNWFMKNIDKSTYSLEDAPIKDRSTFNAIYGLYLANFAINDPKLRKFTYCAGEATMDAFWISQTLKHVFGRARPNLSNKGPYSWFNYESTDTMSPNTSFPSTHGTVYFALSTIIGKSIENEVVGDCIGVLMYTNIYNHNHWVSDMFVSYLLGKAIAIYVWEKRSKQELSQHWWIYPTWPLNQRHPNINLIYIF